MPKIKLTKNELKHQRDALKRFERYLPTLQLKKQQLQLEMQRAHGALDQLRQEEVQSLDDVGEWVHLLDPERQNELEALIQVNSYVTAIRNIAGIDVPVFESLTFESMDYDLFETPIWFDDALTVVKQLVELRLKLRLLREQLALIEQELRVVSQRVNLFEKVKIPEAQENIRKIQIYLGDQQTSAVGRAKIAKEKTRARDANDQLSALGKSVP